MIRRGPEPCALQRDRLARVMRDRDADEVLISHNAARWIEIDPARTGNVNLDPGVGVAASSAVVVVIGQMHISGYEPRGNSAQAQRGYHQHCEVTTTAAPRSHIVEQMDKRTRLNAQLPEASKQRRDANIEEHKLRTSRIKRSLAARKKLQETNKEAKIPKVPLDFLAIGDSWFEYPLYNEVLSFQNNAIVAQSQLGSLQLTCGPRISFKAASIPLQVSASSV
jgi:hypothetical protein